MSEESFELSCESMKKSPARHDGATTNLSEKQVLINYSKKNCAQSTDALSNKDDYPFNDSNFHGHNHAHRPLAFDAKLSVKEIDKDNNPFKNPNFYDHDCVHAFIIQLNISS